MGPFLPESIRYLEAKLVSQPILAFPDFRQQFILYTDASDAAIGDILSQFQDGQE